MKDLLYETPERGSFARLVSRLAARTPLGGDEVEALAALPHQVARVARGRIFLEQGEIPAGVHIVVSGWALRSIQTGDGRRQIASIALPGDVVGLTALSLGAADYTATAASRVMLATVGPEAFRDCLAAMPRLRARFDRMQAEAMVQLRDEALRLGRLTAQKRIAHYLCEIHARLDAVGLVTEGNIDFPITQTDLSDALGLSLVHTNRQLQELRRMGLIRLERGRLHVPDIVRLRQLGEYADA